MRQIKSVLNKTSYMIFFIVFSGTMLFPFIFIFFSSFKTPKDIMAIPPSILPDKWILSNYMDAFTIQPLHIYLRNSFITSILVVMITIVIGSMAAYALSRTNIKGKKVFLVFLLAISLLPPVTIINPIYQLLSSLKLLNSYIGLALVITVLELPLVVWMLTAYFNTLPKSLEESGEIDGANIIQIFTKILFPLIGPGIFTVSILVFINAWNQFLFALVLNPYESHRAITVGLTLYKTDYVVPWGVLSSAAVITVIPLIVMILLLQKRILSGVLEGGVKE
ncbi:carbohydrate ABC transporter permease [Vallitalea okinawensis]|uniref:carbohydrate ABC transporter permease n=1 Tax=Vallitalea okinawensis TaxID=2078660 RepID=UPI000CFABC50|nr:carbohydrate ABC transporter permease [Vallitalea okinawensis]